MMTWFKICALGQPAWIDNDGNSSGEGLFATVPGFGLPITNIREGSRIRLTTPGIGWTAQRPKKEKKDATRLTTGMELPVAVMGRKSNR